MNEAQLESTDGEERGAREDTTTGDRAAASDDGGGARTVKRGCGRRAEGGIGEHTERTRRRCHTTPADVRGTRDVRRLRQQPERVPCIHPAASMGRHTPDTGMAAAGECQAPLDRTCAEHATAPRRQRWPHEPRTAEARRRRRHGRGHRQHTREVGASTAHGRGRGPEPRATNQWPGDAGKPRTARLAPCRAAARGRSVRRAKPTQQRVTTGRRGGGSRDCHDVNAGGRHD